MFERTKNIISRTSYIFYIKQYFSDAENANNTAIKMELDVYVPSIQVAVEYDGVYYHKSAGNKKREEKKNKACADANIQLIRVREKGLDSYSDCVCITDIDSADMMMLNNAIVEILSLMGISKPDVDIQKDMQRILSTYLVSEHRRNLLLERPDLAAEWHPTKNGNVKPENLAYSSGKKVWWKCEKGHVWQASLHNRVKGKGCPYCSGRVAIRGENDLATLHPELMKEWNEEKNLPLCPMDVKSGSNVKVWWVCKICGHEWNTTVNNRVAGHGCPKCGEMKKGPKRKTHECFENELKSVNSYISLVSRYVTSTQKVKCSCKRCGHEWMALPGNLLKGKGCPNCAKIKRKNNSI